MNITISCKFDRWTAASTFTAPLTWHMHDIRAPALVEDAIPNGVTMLQMSNAEGSSFYYIPGMSVDEFMSRCTLWETINYWRKLKRERET